MWCSDFRNLFWSSWARYNIWTLNYISASSLYHLAVFDMCTVGNSITLSWYTNSSLGFCSKGNFPFIQVICLIELSVKLKNGWLRRWIRSKFHQKPLYSFHTLILLKHRAHLALCRGAIFLSAVPPAANHLNCMCTLWCKTCPVVIWCLKVWIYILSDRFTIHFQNCKHHSVFAKEVKSS
jgi:hypothetical protein